MYPTKLHIVLSELFYAFQFFDKYHKINAPKHNAYLDNLNATIQFSSINQYSFLSKCESDCISMTRTMMILRVQRSKYNKERMNIMTTHCHYRSIRVFPSGMMAFIKYQNLYLINLEEAMPQSIQ